MKEIAVFQIIYKDINISPKTAPMVRGYFANKYKEIDNMHNHNQDKFIYRYPNIQYKVVDNNPIIVGIEEGANILKKKNIFLEDEIKIGENIIVSNQREITSIKATVGVTSSINRYKFMTPWIALNQNNVKLYKKSDIIEKDNLLNKILVGNILSFSKGIGYTVNEQLKVKLNLKQIEVNFKGNKMVGFVGEFYTNFKIPDYLAIGKSISRGFGTIKKVG